MTTITLQPDSVSGLDTSLRNELNQATAIKFGVGRDHRDAVTTTYTTITGYVTEYKWVVIINGYYVFQWSATSPGADWVKTGVTRQVPVYTTVTTTVPASTTISRGVLKFDFSALAGGTINAATLILYAYGERSNTAGNCSVYRCSRNWVETQATRDIYSTGNSWETAYGDGTNDHASTLVGSVVMNGGGIFQYNISLLPSEIQTMVDVANYGFWMTGLATDNCLFWILSSNHSTQIYRPLISIDYDAGAGGDSSGGISCMF